MGINIFQIKVYILAIASVSLLLILTLYAFFFQPRWILNLYSKFNPGAFFFLKCQQKLVALTIDDGPDSKTTSQILDILSKYNSSATFFVISSRVEGNENIVRSIVKQGHELGNHMTKDEPSISLPLDVFEGKLIKAGKTLSQYDAIKFFRPASGYYNQNMIDIAKKHNYTVVLGSIFPYDTHIHYPSFASYFIKLNIKPGSIIVLHDYGDRGLRTIKILSQVLPILVEQKGYRVVTLSELKNNCDL